MSNIDRKIVKIKTLFKGRYLILEQFSHKLGIQTFLAQDTDSQKLVIVKIILFGYGLVQWDDFKLFEREAKTLKNIDHLFIPEYLDYFEINEDNIQGFALVQAYIDAPSLDKIVNEGRKFSEAELIELAEKLLAILIYLHQQIPPVIHRDIKPSNILITNRSGNSIGDVYLVDFGAAKTVANKENSTITIIGTYGYIPLEQFGGQATPASDLYSLGMTLIFLITGIPPAELPHVNGKVKFNSNNLSGKFTRWLAKMTYPHLDKRFNSAKSAFNVLKSKDSNSGEFLNLKPAGSCVKLYRDCHKFKIAYKALDRGTRWELCPIIFLILWMLFDYFFGGLGFVTAIFLICPLLNLINFVFPQKIQYWIISIDCNGYITKALSNSEELTKTKMDFFDALTKDINLLVYNPEYISNDDKDKINGNRVKVKPTISIYAGLMQYQFGESLSQEELWWLGQELSDFLGLELQISKFIQIK
jgi:serine/threonine protein kinase